MTVTGTGRVAESATEIGHSANPITRATQPARAAPAPPAWSFRMMLLDPPRDTLRNAIEKRFASMLTAGALREAAALLTLRLDPALPALRAVGLPELSAHLRGELTLEEAAQLIDARAAAGPAKGKAKKKAAPKKKAPAKKKPAAKAKA